MIILITTWGNGYTLESLVKGTYGVATPKFRVMSYNRLFRSFLLPKATYIFADLERLAPWELRLAAGRYETMVEAGLRCLNNPARSLSRVELSEALYRAGINGFRTMRADTSPMPARFPVFLRGENDHAKPDPTLYDDQTQLEAALESLRTNHVPLRGMLVSELETEPYGDGLWAKWGTWRIGDQMIVEHIAVDDTWLVKTGDHAKVTDAVAQDEHDAVAANRYAEPLRKAFDVASIEFGRADHSTVNGRQAIYEINTNPYSGYFVADHRPVRRETQLIARSGIAKALDAIDTIGSGWVRTRANTTHRPIRWWRPGFITPRRP